jgi:hypothetical protein
MKMTENSESGSDSDSGSFHVADDNGVFHVADDNGVFHVSDENEG